MWLSLFSVLLYNPLASWALRFPLIIAVLISWLALAGGVLLIRNLIAALMEGAGVLTALHRKAHAEENRQK